MIVDVIGSSCTWFERNNTSFILDKKILFDVPEGNYKGIISCVDLFSIKAIIITHFHTDHFIDFHIVATRFMRERRDEKNKLKVYGPKGVLEKMIAFNKLFCGAPDECDPENYLKYIEFIDLTDGFEFELEGYKVRTYSMDHGPVCYGFTFTDENGKTFGFSADTRLCDNLHKILEKSNYAFVEMSAIKPSKTHIMCLEFVELTEKYKNCKLIAIHTPDICVDFAKENNLNYVVDGDVLDLN